MFRTPVLNGPALQQNIPPLPAIALNSTAQLAWFNLYQASQPQQRHPPPETLFFGQDDAAFPTQLQPPDPNELPLVGSDYEFVVPQDWPRSVARIKHNVFSASKPYPVTLTPEYADEKCECELCCISSTGTHLTSSCINVNTATICDDSTCLLGARCGNRFEQCFELDLIQSRVVGVVSPNRIPQGAFIVEYVSEILYAEDAVKRSNRRYQARFRTEAEWVERRCNNGGTV